MSDLKIPERRDSEEDAHQPEPEAPQADEGVKENPEKKNPGILEVHGAQAGNCDVLTVKLLESMNQKLYLILQMLDVRLPRVEDEDKKE